MKKLDLLEICSCVIFVIKYQIFKFLLGVPKINQSFKKYWNMSIILTKAWLLQSRFTDHLFEKKHSVTRINYGIIHIKWISIVYLINNPNCGCSKIVTNKYSQTSPPNFASNIQWIYANLFFSIGGIKVY